MNFLIGGLTEWAWWWIVFYTLGVTHITIVAVTVFLHRVQAHGALELSVFISHFFRGWLWLTTGMVTKEWKAVHKKHHAKCETADDPHSPKTRGIGTVLRKGSELYRQSVKDMRVLTMPDGKTTELDHYGRGAPDDWIERRLYSRFVWEGVALMLIIDFLLFGAIGVTVWAVQMLWIPINAAGIINGLGHWWGYRNFETPKPDASTNLSPWGIIIGGEELHNNHHAYPASAKFSARPWEFDIGWGCIRFLVFLGQARVKTEHLIPREDYDCFKNHIDEETLRAVQALRFDVLRWFDHAKAADPQNGRVHWQVMREGLIHLWESQESIDALIAKLDAWRLDALYSQSRALQVLARRLVRLKVVRAL